MLSTTLIKIYEHDMELLKKEIEAYPDDALLWKIKNGISNSAVA